MANLHILAFCFGACVTFIGLIELALRKANETQ